MRVHHRGGAAALLHPARLYGGALARVYLRLQPRLDYVERAGYGTREAARRRVGQELKRRPNLPAALPLLRLCLKLLPEHEL